MQSGKQPATDLVDRCLDSIHRFDQAGPCLNSFIVYACGARRRAEQLDRLFRERGRPVGPLHGVPIVVKDNIDVSGLPTTAGSASLGAPVPAASARVYQRLRGAGAVLVGKTNLYEFALSPFETRSSVLPGHTRNPYDPARVPGGSSGGTAAAVSAGFAIAGLGTDTGNSVRGPSAHTALVGIRPTFGLVSRAGIVPALLDHDTCGPIARTVADAALLLDIIAGYDPADTASVRRPAGFSSDLGEALDAAGLGGTRIGVLPQLVERDGADARVHALFQSAVRSMEDLGAAVVDVAVAELDALVPPLRGDALEVWCPRFRHDIEGYLRKPGSGTTVRSLREIIESGLCLPDLVPRLEWFDRQPEPGANPLCRRTARNCRRLAHSVRRVMDSHALTALAYPTWSNPPRKIGDLASPDGGNSAFIASHSGMPSITVPMGYVDGSLPAGLELTGRAFSDATLVRLAHSYEQATRHRQPPLL